MTDDEDAGVPTAKWFGPPWPSAELRAPVCEDDADKVPTPVGHACTVCWRSILDDDQGVLIPCLLSETAWEMLPTHIVCFLRQVVDLIPPTADDAAAQWVLAAKRALDERPTPVGDHCPRCGQRARYLLDHGRQAFCGNDDCQVLTWNPTKTRAEMDADHEFVDWAPPIGGQ